MGSLRNNDARAISRTFKSAYEQWQKEEAGKETKVRPLADTPLGDYHAALKALGITSQVSMDKALGRSSHAHTDYNHPEIITPKTYEKLVNLRQQVFDHLNDQSTTIEDAQYDFANDGEFQAWDTATSIFTIPTKDNKLYDSAHGELLSRCLVDGFNELSEQRQEHLLMLLAELLHLERKEGTTLNNIEWLLDTWQQMDWIDSSMTIDRLFRQVASEELLQRERYTRDNFEEVLKEYVSDMN